MNNESSQKIQMVITFHTELLERERLPESLVTKGVWDERFSDIRNIESYLSHNGLVIRKFFLNVSKKEQKRRLLERLDDPEKNWKFSVGDLKERELWDDYMDAYEDMIRQTATKQAPWYVVPADNKWFTRIVVASALIDALASLDLGYPKLAKEELRELAVAKRSLLGHQRKG